MKSARFLLVSVFLFLSGLRAAEPTLKVLLATTDPARGKRFQAFLEKNGIACTPVGYAEVTPELLERHDLFMPDTPEGSFQEVSEAMRKVDLRALPKTGKPVFGIGSLGRIALRPYGIALGQVKT